MGFSLTKEQDIKSRKLRIGEGYVIQKISNHGLQIATFIQGEDMVLRDPWRYEPLELFPDKDALLSTSDMIEKGRENIDKWLSKQPATPIVISGNFWFARRRDSAQPGENGTLSFFKTRPVFMNNKASIDEGCWFCFDSDNCSESGEDLAEDYDGPGSYLNWDDEPIYITGVTLRRDRVGE